jgi:putative ABC transport system substrate-binding protein
MRRRDFIRLMGGVAAWPLAAHAQQPQGHLFRIGWLVFGGAPLGIIDRTLQNALAERGLIQGKKIELTFRHANGNPARLAVLADELVAERPNLLVGLGGDVIQALMGASKDRIPVVGGVSDDPVRAGIAASLARPGKSFTGVTFITDELAPKRIELLKEAVPGMRRVAVIWNPQHLDDEITFTRKAADTLGIGLSSHPVTNMADVDGALREAKDAGAEGIFVIPSRLTSLSAGKIARFSVDHRLAVATAWREFVDVGCLLSYGPSRTHQMRRVAEYVEKIMAGARPAELPVERPTKFELVINHKTAKAIGLELSPTLLARADDVIE